MKELYQMTSNEVRQKLNGKTEPLTNEEIAKRQQEYGLNELVEEKKKNVFQVFLKQFADFLVIILIIAAIVSAALGDVESSVVILVVITMNGILGTVQTIKAEHSLQSLKELSMPMAKVIRDGQVMKISSKELTIGDVVCLEAGDYVPADGRIIESAGLKIDESMLTGESLVVDKTDTVIEEEKPLAERTNMVYSGSLVSFGRGSYIVTSIGMNTEIGKIASLLKATSEKRTPLQISLDKFGQKLSIIILIFCAILFTLNIIQGENIENAFMFAVALAVAAIPEALSSIVTIVLSFGTQKMAKENAIIRKLQAVEGLGSISVICSDKTGTLTQNKMTIEDAYCLNDDNLKLAKYSILCNDASIRDDEQIGDPTEVAFVVWAENLGISVEKFRADNKRISENPFDSDRKLMSTLNVIVNDSTINNVNDMSDMNNSNLIMITKGATDIILSRLANIEDKGIVRQINAEDKREIEKKNIEFSQKGMRVLAVAYKNYKSYDLTIDDEDNLTFLGLAAMVDPPREQSESAVQECKEAGIKPIMITGDYKVTAAAIAKRIGILENADEACEGSVIDKMSDEELENFVENISVYARVSPEHKIRIVKAWQAKGNIVAMTGDGVNDAPALKQADVGVAMGITGSEVSKDAAAMVLTDDNFQTIVKAIENGRNIYQNIKNSIQFLLSGNFAGILAVLFASIAMLPVPFAPVHLLFINLLTDSLPAIALGFEKGDKDVMKKPPRDRNESIMTKDFLINVGIEGLVIAVTTMTAFMIGYRDNNALLASTMAFGTLCMGRLFHGFNCKSDKPVIFNNLFSNKWLIGSFLTGVILMSSVLMIPVFHTALKVQTLSIAQLLIIYALAAADFLIIQLLKWLKTLI
ncbi:cation-translocating P-type ATPase [Bovifimicola ammoniilytica]|jgi:Ca2+-transporting ATPase|uniref:cation-translocating P-type ATPase n=1 Tax=Bovifimicola ammoniilytica TaxID=2981720 RepID=UPI00082183FF|nr:cation-translocating P-type ATPase [Bovifimicola ammoniilytica]MCU6753574.1 cation-translocating P-type ATPase [Bovifimicola ammoniilytica]SCJ67154.1 Calcium-transporting ATPase lmo0841 [uncultured Eubacterium sp.]